MIRIRRLLSLLLFLFPLNHCSPTCPYHIDGPLCQNNSECTGISKCFFGNNSTLGWGRCCAVDQGSYYNAIFDLLIDDPESRIPGELFSPVGKDTCESSKDCLHSEVCMVSKRKGDSDPPKSVPIDKTDQIKMHCYKKHSHWMTIPGSYSLQFCDSNSDCTNNNCFEMTKKLKNYEMIRQWETEKVVIYFSVNKKNNTQDEKNGILKMEELDEINKNDGEWIMDFKDTIQLFHSNASDCKITFKGKRDKKIPESPSRVRSVKLQCDKVDEIFHEDIEIFGAKITLETEIKEYTGLCGHPNLKCKDCLINGKLFTCKEDKDCYHVSDHEYLSRNEKAFCTNETHNGNRLCKREQYTCPPDSLNDEGSFPGGNGTCEVDEDCINMSNYTTLDQVDEVYYPHCFNGACCARRRLCQKSLYPYALPLEVDLLGEAKQCRSNYDCTMFPDLIGTCVFNRSVEEKLMSRERKFLNSTLKTKRKLYGMCCYSMQLACRNGGTLLLDELSSGSCSNHSDCNPEMPPFKWNAYCESKVCCKDDPSNIMCPDGVTPFRSEPLCEGVIFGFEDSGECPKANGMCYRGHCCPKLHLEKQIAVPYEGSYLTEIPCDPSRPLDIAYHWSYCDRKTEKIMVMGDKNWLGNELDWQRERCTVHRDCGHEMFLCVHRFFDIKFCVIDPQYHLPTNQSFLWTMVIWICAVFVGIVIIILMMPTPLY